MTSSLAQDAPQEEDGEEAVVRSVSITGNTFFSDSELKRRIRTEPNRRILSIPGLTWWRWIYQLGDSGVLGKRVGRALKASGEPPAVLDSTALSDDVERLRLFYEQQGFRDAAIAVEVIDTEWEDRVRVIFRVRPGQPTYIRTVRYDGLDMLNDEQKRRLVEESVIEPEAVSGDSLLVYEADDTRYSKPRLLEERGRLLTYLRNQGYAAISRDSIRAIVYQPKPDSFDVTFRVRPGERYRFGRLTVRIEGTEPEAAPETDTLDVETTEAGKTVAPVIVEVREDGRVGTGIVRRALQYKPGAVYDRSKVLATKRRLEGTGVFAFTNISTVFSDTVHVPGIEDPFLPLRIDAQTRNRHRVRAETFVLQRDPTGDPTTTTIQNEFGVGVGLTYENVNAFGGGETFRANTSGSIATGLDSTIVTSAQFEATTSLTLPYLLRPFRFFESVYNLRNARTRLSLSFLTARRNDLGLLIRGRGSARMRLEMEHTPTLISLVDVLDVSLSNPDALPQFEERFLRRVFGDPDGGGGITDPVQRTQILEDYTQPQVNTAFRYTLRSATANPLRRDQGHVYEASAEIGNLIPLALDEFAFSPGRIEYSLPGLFGSSSDGTASDAADGVQGGRLIYRPYARATLDIRQYHPLSRGTTFAYKVFGGVALPIARPNRVPFDRRFFSGGATSVRGWELRALGPGGASLTTGDSDGASSGDIANILGGDVKFETSAELRTVVLRNILGGNWGLATFVDAGNVWFGPRNPGLDGDANRPGTDGRFRLPDAVGEIGVGSGIGIRIMWDYLVARLDYAWKIHDPSPAEDDVLRRSFGAPEARVLHFGIGHTF
ncbi:BamA/TamA family outer membrane protein [Longibacter salinarum]|nr:BamA/TamA family outer membrane protein [Longibacter salinarum]